MGVREMLKEMSAIQMTMWESQYKDGTLIDGGRQDEYSTDQNVSVVDVTQLSQFSIIGNTMSDEWYDGHGWYRDGVAYNYTYPTMYQMHDTTILTVDWDATLQQFKFTQTVYTGPKGSIY